MAEFRQSDLEALYRRLEKPLYNVVYRTVWDREEAHDLVQEAFARLWSMRARVDPATVEPLVYRIALNGARSWNRKRRIRSIVGIERLAGFLRTTDDADRDLREDERRDRVRRAVTDLPQDVRDVVLLTSFSDLGYREIAAVLGIPEGTVGSRRNRGLRLLRERLSERWHERLA